MSHGHAAPVLPDALEIDRSCALRFVFSDLLSFPSCRSVYAFCHIFILTFVRHALYRCKQRRAFCDGAVSWRCRAPAQRSHRTGRCS